MSAGISQQFCVRWNSHLGSLGAAFPQLLAGQRFVDVTLACEGHQVHCHRLVLAACSTYFESLLGENPCKHPIIILPREIKLWEIQALVDFMYKGEVNVSQAGLPDLLKCAETLQIRGLCGSDATLNLNHIVSGISSSSSTSVTSSIASSSSSMTAAAAAAAAISTPCAIGSGNVCASPSRSTSIQCSSSGSVASAATTQMTNSLSTTMSTVASTNLSSNSSTISARQQSSTGNSGGKIVIGLSTTAAATNATSQLTKNGSSTSASVSASAIDISSASSTTHITNILRNELLQSSTNNSKYSTTTTSNTAAIVMTPTPSPENGEDSANGSSNNELNIKCEEMDDYDGNSKTREEFDDMDGGAGKMQSDKCQQSDDDGRIQHQLQLPSSKQQPDYVLITSQKNLNNFNNNHCKPAVGSTIRVKSNENLFENYNLSHHHPSHIVTAATMSTASNLNDDCCDDNMSGEPIDLATFSIIDDDVDEDDDEIVSNAHLLPPSLKYNRKTMQISVKSVTIPIGGRQEKIRRKQLASTARPTAPHRISSKPSTSSSSSTMVQEQPTTRLSSESFESIICSPHLEPMPYCDDENDEDEQIEIIESTDMPYMIDDDDEPDIKIRNRWCGMQMPRLLRYPQIQNENSNDLNGGDGGAGGGGDDVETNMRLENIPPLPVMRPAPNSSTTAGGRYANHHAPRKYDTKDSGSLLMINGDQGAPPPSAVVLRNPRSNQPRTYNTDALYAALMDVKFGESIYRASQIHKVPRKTLRNWMKRWDIKSAYPMPRQLKQAAENKRRLKIIQNHNMKTDI